MDTDVDSVNLVIVNSAAGNTRVQVFLPCTYFPSFSVNTQMWIPGLFLAFGGPSIQFSIVSVLIYISTDDIESLPFLHILINMYCFFSSYS